MSSERLDREFFARDPREVAPDLLGKVIHHRDLAARIVEVEAYVGGEDPASHAYKGETPRTTVMFGPPGHLYVYFTYGMHWCANVVCGEDGVAGAVLLRGAEPLSGLSHMYRNRIVAKRDSDLCSGPAKLAQSFGWDGSTNGVDIAGGIDDAPWIGDDGTAPEAVVNTGRVGITRAVEEPWRWYVADNPNVSGPR